MEEKVFMTKKDIKSLFGAGISNYFIDKVFEAIRTNATQQLKKNKKVLPNKSYIPTSYAREYLRDYGINI